MDDSVDWLFIKEWELAKWGKVQPKKGVPDFFYVMSKKLRHRWRKGLIPLFLFDPILFQGFIQILKNLCKAVKKLNIEWSF